MTATIATREPNSHVKVATASLIGTAIEWYDFFVYGTAAALIFKEVGHVKSRNDRARRHRRCVRAVHPPGWHGSTSPRAAHNKSTRRHAGAAIRSSLKYQAGGRAVREQASLAVGEAAFGRADPTAAVQDAAFGRD